MITLSAVYARMKRQKFKEFSAANFLHRNDVIRKIPDLHSFIHQQFLFGIYHSEKKWTVIIVNFLYAVYEGDWATLRLDTETDKIFQYFSIENNDFSSDIQLKDGRRIWMKSAELSSLI